MGTWSTDLLHFLDENHALPSDLPWKTRRIAEFLGCIVSRVTKQRHSTATSIEMKCQLNREMPNCAGEIQAWLTKTGVIKWLCPACGENGTICGWEETLWDCSS